MASKNIVRAVSGVQRRALSTSPPRASAVDAAVFSAGEDGSALKQTLARLVDGAGKWTLTTNGMGIERQFRFKSFKQAWVSCL